MIHRTTLESLESRTLLTMATGMNLERAVDYNPGYMFTDAFIESRVWISHAYNTVTGAQTFDGGGAVNVDARGWPTSLNQFTNASGQLIQQRLGTQMFTSIGGHYPAGTYTAWWKGAGTLSWGSDVTAVTPQGDTADGYHRALLTVNPTNAGMSMRIDTLSPSDPIRDVHVWAPDYNGQSFVGQIWRPGASFSPFHPLLKEKLDPFASLRFMHVQDTVPADIVDWSDRRAVDAARQSTYATDVRNGMAPEHMIQLANELSTNPWFCMPHQGSDDFVQHFAQLVHDSLDSNLKVYVEWSNEAWNYTYGYEGHAWLNQQLQLPENAGLNIYDLWAREMKRDFDIWSQVFADRPGQIVRVVSGQAANIYVATQLLQRMEGKFDAVSCDTYVTFNQAQLQQFGASTTVDDVYSALYSQALPGTLQFITNHENLARQYGTSLGRPIQLVSYEGGLLLFGNGQPYNAPFLAAGSDPRVYGLYEQLMRGASSIGMDLFEAFVFTDISSLADAGHLRWLDQPLSQAHKYRALMDAVSGALYTPEFSISLDSATPADEQGPRAASFRITRTGDADLPITLAFAASGTASPGDYTGLPAAISFAAGEISRLVTITPVDDALNEGDQTLTLTLTAGSGYRVLASAASATMTIRDNDNRAIWSVPIANPSFETGVAGWTLSPATGNFVVALSAVADPNAPTAAHHGSNFAWGGGTTGGSGGGALIAGVVQRIDVSVRAASIDAGQSVANFRGWGAGSGAGQQSAYMEIAFFSAATGGAQLGSTITSNVVYTPLTWSEMVAAGAIPAGTRGIELRAFTQRPATHFGNRSGFDDFTATLESPLPAPPSLSSWRVNDGSAQRSMVNSFTVTFSSAVNIGAGAFEVRQRGGAAFNVTASNPSSDRKTWVLAFSGTGVIGGSLPDGWHDLTLRASSIVDDSGQALSGGDQTLGPIARLLGDSDGDGDVDALDALRFRQAQTTMIGSIRYQWYFDADNDGDIDGLDALRFRQQQGRKLGLPPGPVAARAAFSTTRLPASRLA